jgi:antitoxin MazE
MLTRVAKWGNSLGVRIPRSFAREVRVSEGSTVDVTLESGQLMIRPVETRPFSLDGLLDGVTAENLHDETDTGVAVGGEAW